MTVYDLSPGFVRIFYNAGSIPHTMTLPVKPVTVTPGDNASTIEQYDGTAVDLATAIGNWIPFMKGLSVTTTEFTRAELWSKPLPTSDPIYITGEAIGEFGTSAATVSALTQVTLTHRTSLGNIQKLVLFGSVYQVNVRDPFPFASAATTNLSNFMRGVNAWIYGRDGGKLIVPIAATSKTNDPTRARELGI